MNFFQRRSRLKGANYLELRPIRNAKEEVDSDNNVTILIPKFTSPFAKKYFEPILKTPVIKLKLDELGSAAWLAMDGIKNVNAICSELVVTFGDKIQPVEQRLTQYLTQLYNHKLITFEELKGD